MSEETKKCKCEWCEYYSPTLRQVETVLDEPLKKFFVEFVGHHLDVAESENHLKALTVPRLKSKLSASEARVRELEEALEPFAKVFMPETNVSDDPKYQAFLDTNQITPQVTMGDYRRAWKALSRPGAGEEAK